MSFENYLFYRLDAPDAFSEAIIDFQNNCYPYFEISIFTELALGPLWSSSRNVHIFISPLPMSFFSRPLTGPHIVAGSTRQQTVGRNNQAADRCQDQPGSRQLAGSTKQQTIGRINQAADSWQDQPGSRPLARPSQSGNWWPGRESWLTVGRIN